MKKLLLSLLVVMSVSAFSSDVPRFSAFSDGESLHITVMADTCNAIGADLVVDSDCQESRMIENYALSCAASLRVIQTQLMCGDQNLKPKVISIKLSESNVAREAKSLELNYQGSKVTIALD